MSMHDMERLRADASGNTGLSAVLGEAVEGFADTGDALSFLASRGFEVTADELTAAARADDAGEGGYGALLRFVARH